MEVPLFWVDQRSCKHCFKNEWTLVTISKALVKSKNLVKMLRSPRAANFRQTKPFLCMHDVFQAIFCLKYSKRFRTNCITLHSRPTIICFCHGFSSFFQLKIWWNRRLAIIDFWCDSNISFFSFWNQNTVELGNSELFGQSNSFHCCKVFEDLKFDVY